MEYRHMIKSLWNLCFLSLYIIYVNIVSKWSANSMDHLSSDHKFRKGNLNLHHSLLYSTIYIYNNKFKTLIILLFKNYNRFVWNGVIKTLMVRNFLKNISQKYFPMICIIDYWHSQSRSSHTNSSIDLTASNFSWQFFLNWHTSNNQPRTHLKHWRTKHGTLWQSIQNW